MEPISDPKDLYVEINGVLTGPHSLEELRRLRAAYLIPAGSWVSNGEDRRIIEELLPEFKTGVIQSFPYALSRLIFGWLLAVLRMCRSFVFNRIRGFSFRRFSLRTLLIVLTIVCLIMGFFGRDYAETVRQRSIASKWSPNYFASRKYSNLARKPVTHIRITNTPSEQNLPSLSPLSELRSVYILDTAKISKENYTRLFEATTIEELRLPTNVNDDDLVGLENLHNLKELNMRHADAAKTLRRLRGHPTLDKLKTMFAHLDERSLNDLATIQNGIPEYHGYWENFYVPYKRSQKFYSTAALGGRYNITLLGPQAEALYEMLATEALIDQSEAIRYGVARRNEIDYFFNTPHSISGISFVKDESSSSLRRRVLGISTRSAWMADRAVIAINNDFDDYADMIEACRIVRLMKVPSWVLVILGSDQRPENVDRLRAACEREIGTPAASFAYGMETGEMWTALEKAITLRPPSMTNRFAQNKRVWASVEPKLQYRELQLYGPESLFNDWKVCYGASVQGSCWLDVNYKTRKLAFASYGEFHSIGDEVAIVTNRDRILCLGTVERLDRIQYMPSP